MSKGRVLVVDDDADLLKSIRLVLTKAGYDVVEAENGEKAVEVIRSGDNPLLVSAIICDLSMPKVGGMEAIAFFRSQFPGFPLLVLTGNPSLESVGELYKQGGIDYLVKPVVPEKLLAAVERAVEMPRRI